jgi:outer membrane protein assembly factor BamB
LAACGSTQPAQPVAAPATGIVLLSLQDGSQKGAATIGTDAVAVIVSDDGRMAYLADSSPGDVYAADLPSMHVKWKSHVGDAPFGLLLFGGHLLVSLFDTTAVVELDPSSGKQLARHTVPQGPAVMTLDAMGTPLVAGTRGNVARLDGSTVPAGHGFGVAVVGADTWTADYERAELVRAGDGHIVGMPLPLFPFWLAPGKDGTLLIAAEGGTEDTDPGGVFRFNPASGAFTTLAQPRDPDLVLQSGDTVFVAAHGDHEVLDITAGRTAVWASGTSPVALATDPKLGLLVVAVNAHE